MRSCERERLIVGVLPRCGAYSEQRGGCARFGSARCECSRCSPERYSIFQVALLHDTIEDTETTLDELQREFGPRIAGLVAELTDDKELPKAERKRLQVANAGQLSTDAIIVRLADKIYNLRDLNRARPIGWSEERVEEYFQWSSKIARQLVGRNAPMDAILKDLFRQRSISLE